MSQRRQSYTAAEKLAVIQYAEAHGNRAAGRQFDGIDETNIRRWRQQKEQLEKMPRRKRANRSHVTAVPALEAKLMEWIVDRRQKGIGISVVEIRLKAQQLAKLDPSAASFKASYGWARRFMGRNDGALDGVDVSAIEALLNDSDTDAENDFEGFDS